MARRNQDSGQKMYKDAPASEVDWDKISPPRSGGSARPKRDIISLHERPAQVPEKNAPPADPAGKSERPAKPADKEAEPAEQPASKEENPPPKRKSLRRSRARTSSAATR